MKYAKRRIRKRNNQELRTIRVFVDLLERAQQLAEKTESDQAAVNRLLSAGIEAAEAESVTAA